MRKKKYLLILSLVIIVVMMVGLIRQIIHSLQTESRLDRVTEEVSLLQKKNQQLKIKLEEVKSVRFIEQQAREKLNMAREGETVVLIPKSEINKILKKDEIQSIEAKLPNWRRWVKLFAI